MHLLSRSAITTKDECRRRYAYEYLWKGTGFSERRTPIHLAVGIAHHAGVETLHRVLIDKGSLPVEEQLDLVVAALPAAKDAARSKWAEERPTGSFPPVEPPNDEILALLEAMLHGWVRVEAERFISDYEVVSVEREGTPIPLSPSSAFQHRLDAVLRNRYSGVLTVWNTKTTSAWEDWTDLWTTEIQSSTEAWCLTREVGEPVAGTVMAGFNKGSLRQTQGQAHWGSPLLWGYKRVLNGKLIYYADSKAPAKDNYGPWEKFPTWKETFTFVDEQGQPFEAFGIDAWVNWLPAHVVASQFLLSEVLPINEAAVEDFMACAAQDALNDHHVLQSGDERDILLHFAAKRNKWVCGTNAKPKCPFFAVCWKGDSIERLVEAGVLVPRVDHHAKEAA